MKKYLRPILVSTALLAIFIALFAIKPQQSILFHEAAGQSETGPKIIFEPAATTVAPEQVTEPAPEVSETKTTPVPKTKIAAPKPASTPPSCTGTTTQQFVCLLNQYRASKNLGQLSYNAGLADVALSHSQWMNTTGTFSHTGINGSRLGERCASAGITCRGENLAKSATSAQHLLQMWKASAGHNANLLGDYRTVGLGFSGAYVTLLLN